jgi:hypothetical protein
MTSKLEMLEALIKSSYENNELLLETYFSLVSGNITDADIQETLKTVSRKLSEMQSEINHQIVAYKKHI